MNDINSVVIIGRLTRDAELKYTNTGTAVCKFSIAVNRRRKSGDNWVEDTNFFDVIVWGKAGEALNQYLVKGKQVAIEGELRQNGWEQDGQTRSRVETSANNIELLGGNKGGRSAPSARGEGGETYNEQKEYEEERFEDDIPF